MNQYFFSFFSTENFSISPPDSFQFGEIEKSPTPFQIEFSIFVFYLNPIPKRFLHMVQFNSETFFGIDKNSKFSETTITSKISDYLSRYIQPSKIYPLFTPKQEDFSQFFRHLLTFSSNRLLLYYSNLFLKMTKRSSCETLYFQNSESNALELLKTIGNNKVCLIIDQNYSGRFCTVINYYLKKKNCNTSDSNNINDLQIIGFFSCQSQEEMKYSQFLPFDSFTQCMLKPETVAISWHSRHYMKNNVKLPQLNFKELQQIYSFLIKTVEAIAYIEMDKEKFNGIFRGDPTISKLFVNFVFASRILNQINVHPSSYPKFPDLTRHPLWRNFDNFVDNFFKFPIIFTYNQLYISLNNKICENIDQNELIFEFSQFSNLVTIPILCEKACYSLAIYIDSSIKNLEFLYDLDIYNTLLELLKQEKCINYVLFCLIKMLASTNSPNFFRLYDILSHIDLKDQESSPMNYQLILIFFCLIERFYKLNYDIEIEKLTDDNLKMWALFYIAISSPHSLIKADLFSMLQKISSVNKDVIKVKLYALSKIIIGCDDDNIKNQINDLVFNLINIESPDLVYEALHFIYNYKNKDEIKPIITLCKQCSNEKVQNSLAAILENGTYKSYLLENSIHSLLNHQLMVK